MGKEPSRLKWFFAGAGSLLVFALSVCGIALIVSFIVNLATPRTPSIWDGQGTFKSSVVSPGGAYVAKVFEIGAVTAIDSPSTRIAITSIKGNRFSDDSVAMIYPDYFYSVKWTSRDSIEIGVTSKESPSNYPNKFFVINVLKPKTYISSTVGHPTRSVPISSLPTAPAHN